MINKLIKNCTFGLIFISVLLFPTLINADMIYKIELAQETIMPDSTVQVPVVLISDGTVSALQFDILYDTSQTEFQNATMGSSIPNFNMSLSQSATGGKLRVILYSLNSQKVPFGTVPVVYMNFKKLSIEGKLTICNVVLSDVSANNITEKYAVIDRTLKGTNANEIYAQPPIVIDDTGKSTVSLHSSMKVRVQETVSNPTSQKCNVMVMVSVYDEFDKVTICKYVMKEIPEYQTSQIETDISLPESVYKHKLKVCVWDYDKLTPLCENILLYSQN